MFGAMPYLDYDDILIILTNYILLLVYAPKLQNGLSISQWDFLYNTFDKFKIILIIYRICVLFLG